MMESDTKQETSEKYQITYGLVSVTETVPTPIYMQQQSSRIPWQDVQGK